MKHFNDSTVFSEITIGGQFIEVLTSCNEVATRIEPTTRKGRPVNAKRSGGKLVFIIDWEPVFIEGVQ